MTFEFLKMRINMKNYTSVYSKFALILFALIMLLISTIGQTHGYVTISRAYKCSLMPALNIGCGSASESSPDSILAPPSFPVTGPSDGMLASAEDNSYSQLDEQTTNRWHKTEVPTGSYDFHWFLTIPHSTVDYRYFITKTDWNPDLPLTRDSLDLTPFCIYVADNSSPAVTHNCTIPSNYSGYHVIYATWDTSGPSFYQAIDVNISQASEIIFENGFEIN